MTESVLPNESELKSNRLDPPHELLTSGGQKDKTDHQSNESKWLGFAGRDPSLTTQQVDRQASELLTYVREQNREIDDRQAEINAKLAQLDNQLRCARLKENVSPGPDLLHDSDPNSELASMAQGTPEPMLDSGIDLEQDPRIQERSLERSIEPRQTPTKPFESEEQKTQGDPEIAQEQVAEIGFVQQEVDVQINHFHSAHTDPVTYQEFEEVERLVAQFTDSVSDELPSESPQNESHAPSTEPPTDQQSAQETPVRDQDASSKSMDAFPQMLAKSHLQRVDASPQVLGDSDALESERRLLADRKLELDRRNVVLTRMQEETQALHREALEMRLVTEQLWSQLSDSTPPEQLSELIANLRAQLDGHYAKEQTSLDDRRQELDTVQKLLEQKQVALREQANQLQDWFSDRQEDIKGRASEIDAREMLLDQREHRMRDEFAKWQAQRKSYETQLNGLMSKLKLQGFV